MAGIKVILSNSEQIIIAEVKEGTKIHRQVHRVYNCYYTDQCGDSQFYKHDTIIHVVRCRACIL